MIWRDQRFTTVLVSIDKDREISVTYDPKWGDSPYRVWLSTKNEITEAHAMIGSFTNLEKAKNLAEEIRAVLDKYPGS